MSHLYINSSAPVGLWCARTPSSCTCQKHTFGFILRNSHIHHVWNFQSQQMRQNSYDAHNLVPKYIYIENENLNSSFRCYEIICLKTRKFGMNREYKLYQTVCPIKKLDNSQANWCTIYIPTIQITYQVILRNNHRTIRKIRFLNPRIFLFISLWASFTKKKVKQKNCTGQLKKE